MNKKNKIVYLSLLGLVIVGASAVALTSKNAAGFESTVGEYGYNIVLNNANAPELPASYSSEPTLATPDRYVQLAYVNAKNAASAHCMLADGGYIKNNKASGFEVRGIIGVTVTFSGSLKLSYGIDGDDDFVVDLTSGNKASIKGNQFKILSVGESTITAIDIEYSCTRDQYAEGTIEGLAVTRTSDEKVVLNFTSQIGKTYQARVDNGELMNVTPGTELSLELKEGQYAIDVRAKDPSTSTISQWQSLTHKMTYWDAVYIQENNTTWTVWNVDDKPYGDGTLVYGDGTTFVGKFTDIWTRKEGKLTFTNGMYYKGKFVNDQYEDTNGEFSWQSSEGANDGWLYRGGFAGGTPAGQKGNLYLTDYYLKTTTGIWSLEGVLMDGFPSYAANQTTTGGIYCTWLASSTNYNWYEGPINIAADKSFNTTGLSGTLSISRRLWHGNGLQYWTGTMRNDFWPTTDTVGYGEIQFGDNYQDWYEGQILHEGDGDAWYRHGIGTERWSIAGHPNTKDACFTWAWQNASQAFKDEMTAKDLIQDKITAVYDKNSSSGWIYGDGYWYIQTKAGVPYGYVSGQWNGSVDRMGDISASSSVTLDPAYAGALDLTSLWVGQ